MSLACFENFIGIRALGESPKSSLFIEEVPGIDIKRMANIAADSTGATLIRKAIRNACDEACEEALNYRSDPSKSPLMLLNATGSMYSQSKFLDNALALAGGYYGIRFELRRPDYYQHSSLVVKRIYLRSLYDASGVVVRIVDGDKITNLDPIDLIGGETYAIEEVNYRANSRKIEIQADHSAVQLYQAYTPAYNTGCRSCSGRKGVEDSGISEMLVTGASGVTADVALECDTDRIKCAILPYLRYAIQYKAAMNLALEGRFSDRLNFYAASMDFEQFFSFAQEQYNERMMRVVPSIRSLLRPQDRNCFFCSGTTRTTIAF